MLASGRAVSGAGHPIKQVGADTGGLFQHLETCQPSLCRTLRVASEASKWQINEDGEVYQLYIFDDLLPHHANSYVEKCSAGASITSMKRGVTMASRNTSKVTIGGRAAPNPLPPPHPPPPCVRGPFGATPVPSPSLPRWQGGEPA